MFEKVKEYFSIELQRAKAEIEKSYYNPTEIVFNAIQRCYGVAEFSIMYCYMDAFDVTEEYNKIKEDLENLLTNQSKCDII